MSKLIFLLVIAYLAWWLWRSSLVRRRPPPPGGYTPDPEQLVRCDRCGVRVPASQIAGIRANCRQCADGR